MGEDGGVYREYVNGLRARERRRQADLDESYRAKRALAARMAEILRSEFGARRVLLIGSLTDRARFHEGSDIDLAVEGVAPERFWQAWGRLEEITGDAFDLVTLETCTPALRARVEVEGVAL